MTANGYNLIYANFTFVEYIQYAYHNERVILIVKSPLISKV
jgi:hypothetical protein